MNTCYDNYLCYGGNRAIRPTQALIVASESTFRAIGKIIDEFCSKLNEQYVEPLIKLWHKYNVKTKLKVNIV